MKKVLIIAYGFNQEISGSVRLRGLAKYLPNYGWKPTIITIKSSNKIINSDCRVIETDYDDLRSKWKKKAGINPKKTVKENIGIKKNNIFLDRLLSLWNNVFEYPDAQKLWFKYAVDQGSKLLDNEKFDVIMSSSYPFTSHLIANDLKQKYDIPWLADLRDLWSQNHYYNYFKIRKIIDRNLEKKTLANADAITTISRPLGEKLKELHEKKKIFPILNGFDPDLKNNGIHLSDNFSLIHAGSFYQGKRDPFLLFKAIIELNSEGKIDIQNIEIKFFGSQNEWLLNEIDNYGLKSVVKLNGVVPRKEIIKKQQESQLLLLLTWDNPEEKGVIPGKLFEYLAAERPILSYGVSEGCVKDILEETNAGVHVYGLNELKKEFLKYYQEFINHGCVGYSGEKSEIDTYSQKNMAKKFTNVLQTIMK